MGQVCDDTFKEKGIIISKEDDINITLKEDLILTGTRNNNYDFWKIPLPKAEKEIQEANVVGARKQDLALSTYNQTTATDLAKYLHACAGYPLPSKWIKATKKGYYLTWSKLDRFCVPQWIKKHIPKSVVTWMRHMKAKRQGVHSTRKQNKETDDEDDPPLEPPMLWINTNAILYGKRLIKETKATISNPLHLSMTIKPTLLYTK